MHRLVWTLYRGITVETLHRKSKLLMDDDDETRCRILNPKLLLICWSSPGMAATTISV